MRALIREWIIPFYALAGVVGLVLYGVLLVDPQRQLATHLLLALAAIWALMLLGRRSRRGERSALVSKTAVVFVGLTLLMYSIGFTFTAVAGSRSVGTGLSAAPGSDIMPVATPATMPAVVGAKPAARAGAAAAAAPARMASSAAVATAPAATPAAVAASSIAARADTPPKAVQRRAAAEPVVVPAATSVPAPAQERIARPDAGAATRAADAESSCGRLLLKLSLGEVLEAADQALLRGCRSRQ